MPEPRRRTWRNRITLLSLERYAEYEPGRALAALRTPALVIFADTDTTTPTDLIRDAVADAPGNVSSLEVPGGHYAVYAAHRDRVARAAAAFLGEHLHALVAAAYALAAMCRPSATARASSSAPCTSAGS